jgi:hypothetical protein
MYICGRAASGGADPSKLGPVKLDLFSSHQLIEIKRRENRADQSQTVRLGYGIEVIGGHHMSGAGHVLKYEIGVSRNVLSHVGADEAGPQVV